ncbi:hypothetical protein ACLI4Z_08915 [Natrialbaceae archaeon A-arb3/5]
MDEQPEPRSDLEREISSFAQNVRSKRFERAKQADSSPNQTHSGTQPHEIPAESDQPDECPECGFEPADPDALFDGSEESQDHRAAILSSGPDPFWKRTAESEDGRVRRIKTVCPECDETVDEYEPPVRRD